MSPKRKVVSRTRFVDPNMVGRRTSADISREHYGTVEAEWSCSSCGTEHIPGFTKVCPNCGNPKSSDETYQPPDTGTASLLSAEELIQAGVDTDHSGDQQCGYCGGFSKPGTAACPYCGANLADVARTCRKCPNCGLETNNVTRSQCGVTTQPKGPEEPEEAEAGVITPPTSEGFDFTRVYPLRWIPVVLLVIGLIASVFWPRQAQVAVSDVSWTYTVSLSEYQYNAHEGWTPMGDATGQETRVHHYDTITDGYHQECQDNYEVTGYESVQDSVQSCESVYQYTDVTCYDDGSCDYDAVYGTECHTDYVSVQEPVYGYVQHCEQVADTHEEPRYATWYFYNVWEWVGIAPVVSSSHDFEPYWPEGYVIDEKHRESGRQEQYNITLTTENGEDTYSYTPAGFDEFNLFQIGTRWSITHSGPVITKIVPAE